MNVAGRTHRLLDKEIAKCLVSGLKPEVFREEMYSRTFDTLEDVIREAREVYLLIGIYWKYLIELKKETKKRCQILKRERKYFTRGSVSWRFQKIGESNPKG